MKTTIIESFKNFRKLFYGDDNNLGQIKEVENEWKAHGKVVLKDLSTKKIIKPNSTQFEVDMIDDVLEFIKEAKIMDSLGVELSRNIQNIVLNEYRFYQEINGLNFMLSEWNDIQDSFNKFEKKTIMHRSLNDLSSTIREGTKKDWKSINKKTQIDKCKEQIDFHKKQTLIFVKELSIIKNAIHFIENLELIKLTYNKNSLNDFMTTNTEHIKNQNLQVFSMMETIKSACKMIELNNKRNSLQNKENKMQLLETVNNLRLFMT